MKKIYSVFIVFSTLMFCQNAIGQANLPSTWDVEGSIPVGWTTDVGSDTFYVAACQGNRSIKFNSVNENLVIHTASQPSSISFLARGMASSAPYWNGSFRLDESSDNLAWSPIDSISGPSALLLDSCVIRSFQISNPSTRYLKLIFSRKFLGTDTVNGGGNVNLDSIYVEGTNITSVSTLDIASSPIQLFPNPTAHNITIQSQAIMDRIKIINALGKVVQVIPANASSYSLDLDGLAKGIYWIEVFGKGTRSVHKLIKN